MRSIPLSSSEVAGAAKDVIIIKIMIISCSNARVPLQLAPVNILPTSRQDIQHKLHQDSSDCRPDRLESNLSVEKVFQLEPSFCGNDYDTN